ncbi:MAG: hypothetical protein ABL962_08790 [Fimbriimonadaceae bacterium]
MKIDFAKFKNSLPYASELYGIYQPLLGWRSRLRTLEIDIGIDSLKRSYLQDLQARTAPLYTLPDARGKNGEAEFQVGVGERATATSVIDSVNSIVARKVSERVSAAGFTRSAWREYTSAPTLKKILDESRADIEAELETALTARHGAVNLAVAQTSSDDINTVLSDILERESQAAGALQRLGEELTPDQIAALMRSIEAPREKQFYRLLDILTPAQSDLAHATISPIGLVRLYRQYFFEFDSFLGPPVQHLWLSPGGVVELVETSTRRTLIERATEQAFESMEKSEKSSSAEDELSDAVRSENSASTKLGVALSVTGNYDVAGFVEGSTTVGSSYDVDQSSKQAREQTHRSLRQQTEKLSSEIRKSFKSTFKTATETTDTQSRRYVINNTTPNLINYELRRKMRQVGVQVEDYGLQLCWQVYVDKPGDELGLAKLVHVATPADLQGIKEPDAPTMPEAEIRDQPFPVKDLAFHRKKTGYIGLGFEVVGNTRYPLKPPKPGYIFSRALVVNTGGYEELTQLRAYPRESSEILKPPSNPSLEPEVEEISTGNPANPSETERSVRSIVIGWLPERTHKADGRIWYWNVEVTVFWKPSQKTLRDVDANYRKAMERFTAERERAFTEALYKAARDRVKVASKIEPRKFEDLRDEERIIVYRSLIRKLLEVGGITDEDPKLRHVFAEVVQSMFDVNKMLYFVAPEWWMPRHTYRSRQNIGIRDKRRPGSNFGRVGEARREFDEASTVNWGGGSRPSDYYITEDSTRARLGSSLGWVLQLDGDNLRNAFLNAPWVKAVVPIRVGHEWKAMEWLSNDAIEGSDGLEADYEAKDAEKLKILNALKAHTWDDPSLATFYATITDPSKIRIIDAIRYLIVQVQVRHQRSLVPVPNPDDATMNYLPTDEVFERGFDPLLGGFNAAGKEPFKVFDQWVEVLPTEQIVPVEVKYDPKSGMQV